MGWWSQVRNEQEAEHIGIHGNQQKEGPEVRKHSKRWPEAQ